MAFRYVVSVVTVVAGIVGSNSYEMGFSSARRATDFAEGVVTSAGSTVEVTINGVPFYSGTEIF